MNAFPGLTWEFSERAKTIDFMDMTISINKSNCIETTLFEKRLNLHLYTPPPTPLTRKDYSLALYTVLCSGSSRYARTMRINYSKQKSFLSASSPVATKETKSDPYSTKLCVCLVCVCVSIFERYFNHAIIRHSFTPTAKNHTSHQNLRPTQFPNPTVIPRCFAVPTHARKK